MELIGGDDIFLDEEAQDKKIPGSIRLKKSKEDKQQSRFGKFLYPAPSACSYIFGNFCRENEHGHLAISG